MAQGHHPHPDEPRSVYRFYDAAGGLLYVGITAKGMERIRVHSSSASYWQEVATIAVEHFPDLDEASAREHALIRYLHPRYNRVPAPLPSIPDLPVVPPFRAADDAQTSDTPPSGDTLAGAAAPAAPASAPPADVAA